MFIQPALQRNRQMFLSEISRFRQEKPRFIKGAIGFLM